MNIDDSEVHCTCGGNMRSQCKVQCTSVGLIERVFFVDRVIWLMAKCNASGIRQGAMHFWLPDGWYVFRRLKLVG